MDLKRLLTPNLSADKVWVDFFDSIQTALNTAVFDKARDLSKLQDSFNYDQVAVMTKQENGDLLTPADLDTFERSLLLLLSDDVGMQWENNSYLSNDDYMRILRYLARYWAVSQTPEFVRFMSFVFNGLFEYKMLWTQDYQHFKPGDQVLVDPIFYLEDWAGKTRQHSAARTNLLPASSNLSALSWTANQLSISAGADLHPDGMTAVDQMYVSAGSGPHSLSTSLSLTAGQTYTFSIYAQQRGIPSVTLGVHEGTNFAEFYYQFLGDVVTSTGNLHVGHAYEHLPMQSAWHRFQITFTALNTGLHTMFFQLGPDVYSGPTSEGAAVFGAQLETGAIATGLLETVGSPVTRTDYTLSGSNVVFAAPPVPHARVILSDNGNLEGHADRLPDVLIGTGNGVTTSFGYALYRSIGQHLAAGGTWYPTSHVRLETDLERYGHYPLDVLVSFFYAFAPINIVLKELVFKTVSTMNLYLSMAARTHIMIRSSIQVPDTIMTSMAARTHIHIR